MAFIDLVEFHSFMAHPLDATSVVVDLGANRGRFTEKMRRRYGCDPIAVEANPELMEDLGKKASRAYNLAITDHVGEIALSTSANKLAATIVDDTDRRDAVFEGTATVPCMDLESFAAHAGLDRIDLLKVDIEGAEIGMFRSCSGDFLRSIPQITVEFHDFCDLTPATEVEACLARFRSLGFSAVCFSRVGHQDVLLINRAKLPLSPLRLAWTAYGYRNIKGAARMLRKLFMGKRWAKNY